MPNYDGLDSFYRSVDSPLQRRKTQNPYEFDSDHDRNTVANKFVQSVGADKILAGTVQVSLNLGSATAGTITLDGANNRIVIHDGTTNRIVIGEV